MPITELLEKNAQMYGDEVSLVEINPKATWNTQRLHGENTLLSKQTLWRTESCR